MRTDGIAPTCQINLCDCDMRTYTQGSLLAHVFAFLMPETQSRPVRRGFDVVGYGTHFSLYDCGLHFFYRAWCSECVW